MTLFGWAGLAGTTFAAALLQAVSGFGFAVLAVPLYLLFLDPAQAVQIAIILSTALSFAVVSGLRRTIAPALLLRLGVGSLAGLPFGLFSFRYADRLLVRLGAGATILAFAVMMAGFRFRGSRGWAPFARTQTGDLAAGAVAGVATALVGMAGPPVLIYLLLAGTAAPTVRATLLLAAAPPPMPRSSRLRRRRGGATGDPASTIPATGTSSPGSRTLRRWSTSTIAATGGATRVRASAGASSSGATTWRRSARLSRSRSRS